MESFILPVIATLAGGFFLIRNIMYLRDEIRLREYIENSPKAKLWVKKFGIKKTSVLVLTQKYLLPFGILASCGLLSIGLWSILNLVKAYA